MAKVGMIAGGGLATALTGGAASPLLAAAIGAGTGAGVGALDGGWKGALLGAGTGAATAGLAGGAGGAAGGAAAGAAKQTATQALRSYATNPFNYAGIAGQVTPGPAGQLLSLAGGAGGGGNVAGNSWLTDLLKNPATYGTLLSTVGAARGGAAAPAGGTAATGAAAPTAGGGSPLPDILRAGGVAGAGAAGGMADERKNQNLFGINQNNAATARYGVEASQRANMLQLAEKAAMDRAALGVTAPTQRQNQVVRGSMLANAQPASFSGLPSRIKVPTLSGGLTPAALSPQARETGRVMQDQALEAIKTKSDVPALPDFASKEIKAPELTGYQGAGALEQTLGAAGTGASMIGSILEALQKQGQGQGVPSVTGPTVQRPVPGVGSTQGIHGTQAGYGMPGDWTIPKPGFTPPLISTMPRDYPGFSGG